MILKMQCVLVLVWDSVCEKEISFLAFGSHHGFLDLHYGLKHCRTLCNFQDLLIEKVFCYFHFHFTLSF
jgi:hypothetical protein